METEGATARDGRRTRPPRGGHRTGRSDEDQRKHWDRTLDPELYAAPSRAACAVQLGQTYGVEFDMA